MGPLTFVVPMSLVDFKKCKWHMSLVTNICPCDKSNFRHGPVACPTIFLVARSHANNRAHTWPQNFVARKVAKCRFLSPETSDSRHLVINYLCLEVLVNQCIYNGLKEN